ncbi:MAG: hypothetical protein JXA82_03875 [Sedimentisphaerales bacterium]|nr:hypothetical protein [Sedimentisphaerales bacterium]
MVSQLRTRIGLQLILILLMVSMSTARLRNLYSDTWVATDALGRSLPDYNECGEPKKNKFVGIFYWTWHTAHGVRGPYDVTQILSDNPINPQWGPVGAAHHWGRPELGYYISTDRYVIRKHASMLSDAGVDAIFFDTTNPPFTFRESYMALCDEFRKMRQQGNQTPQIVFLTPFGDPRGIVQQIYDDLYRSGLYEELWFRWKGKPLILADPAAIENSEILEFFTFRKPVASYFTGPTGANQWGWLEVHPQHGFKDENGRIEEVTVGIAQNAVGSELSMMSHKDGAMGRSWHNDVKDTRPDAVNLGLNFTEQWQRAFELDPSFVFITGWNEWVAGRFTEWYKYATKDSYHVDALFVDQYNHEYSRDIEPMEGGHGDSYYYQMISYIRRFKGVRKPPIASGFKTIAVDGRFEDWADVLPEYRDTIGDTAHRDHKGYGSTHYVNTTGRNDLIRLKVACDSQNVYFYAQTAEPITPHSDVNWMLLFIDSDQNASTDWHGYDIRINRNVSNTKETNLERFQAGKGWIDAHTIPYRVQDHEMELAISREILGLSDEQVKIDFHWADNMQSLDNITEFALSGDSAPNRRFNYRYIGPEGKSGSRVIIPAKPAGRTVAQQTMQAIYEQVKTPYKYGVILKGQEGRKLDCPSVFRHGDKWYMTYIIFDGTGYETALAVSEDLLHWKPLGKILPFRKDAWDAMQAAGYIALQNYQWGGTYTIETYDDKYWMSYLGGALKGYETDPLAIGIAWTTDPSIPVPWNRLKEPVLSRDQPDVRDFERLTQYKSNIIHDKDRTLGYPFVMFYNGKPNAGYERIGMAVSTDMRTWLRYGVEPVIDNGKGISGDPQITRIGDVWVMFYFGAFWRPKAFDTFACSYDLVHWTKWTGPDLVEPSEPWDNTYAHKPWIINHEGVIYHFYCAVGDQGRVIALATSRKMKQE